MAYATVSFFLRELGGDGVYAAWQLTYLEVLPSERPYPRGLCPVAELSNHSCCSFKHNYWKTDTARDMAEIAECDR